MGFDGNNPKSIRSMPLILKVLIGGVPILLVIAWFISLQVNGYNEARADFKKEISSVVLKSNSYYGRSEEFHLANGTKLYFMPPVDKKLMLGDSITKGRSTFIYDVYRKGSNGKYEYWATYNMMETP